MELPKFIYISKSVNSKAFFKKYPKFKEAESKSVSDDVLIVVQKHKDPKQLLSVMDTDSTVCGVLCVDPDAFGDVQKVLEQMVRMLRTNAPVQQIMDTVVSSLTGGQV